MKLYSHPDYTLFKKEWIDAKTLYRGKHSDLTDTRYLWLHELEDKAGTYQSGKGKSHATDGSKLRALREQRSRYINYMKFIYKRYAGIIFKQEAEISDSVKQILENEIKDIDGNGSRFLDFMRDKVFKDRFLFGQAYTLIDSYNTDAETLSDEAENGQRPFLESLDVLSVLDWELNSKTERGQFDFLRHEYAEVSPRLNSNEEPKTQFISKQYLLNDGKYQIEIYTKEKENENEWILKDTIDIKNSANKSFEYIPICGLFAEESFASNLVDPILEHHNMRSYAGNVLGFHGHPTRVITGSGEMSADQRTAFAEFTSVFVPEGTGVTVLNPDPLVALREMMIQAEMNIFKAGFFMSRFMPADSRASQGADTNREQKEEFLSVIKTEIHTMNDYMNKVLRTLADFKGVSDFDGEIKLSDDVTIEDVSETLLMINTFREDIRKNQLWNKAVQTKAVRQMNLPNEDEITESIEAESAPIENVNSAIDNIVNELPQEPEEN